jgi:hypothetical protein
MMPNTYGRILVIIKGKLITTTFLKVDMYINVMDSPTRAKPVTQPVHAERGAYGRRYGIEALLMIWVRK